MKISVLRPVRILALLALLWSGMPAEIGAQTSYNQQDRTNRDGTSTSSSEQAGRSAAASQVSTGASESGYADRYRPDQVNDPETAQAEQPSTQNQRSTDFPDEPRSQRPNARVPVQPSEFEAYVSQVVDKRLTRFGANLLVPRARDFTVPPTATVPASYRLNPGDELVIGLTGPINADQLRRTVSADGQIFLPSIGAVNVAGVPYGDVQSVIAAQVSRQYRGARVSLAIGRLHGITVYVTGFAATPGSYTISSLSTLVNAVLAAGGPSQGGSFRSIQVRRQGKLISDFDLYDLLLKGDKRADVTLENGDVVFIAPIGAQVGVIGSVNNEAIFETRGGETLNDVLIYAGGINTVADETRLLLLNPVAAGGEMGGWQQLSPADVRLRAVRRGEIVRVLSNLGIARPLSQQPVLVTISGEVAKPGRYYVPAGTPMSTVVAQAGGLTGGAYVYGTVFTRERVRQEQQRSFDRAVKDARLALIAEPITQAVSTASADPARLNAIREVVDQLEARKPEGRLVLGIAPDASAVPGDIVLENNDTLYVPPRPVVVGVFGSVPSPSSFEYRPGVRLGDYLKNAGGVQKIGSRSKIFVVRANGTLLAPRRGVFSGSILNEPALPGDLIYVPIDASRGELFAKLGALTSVLYTGALTAATVTAVTQ